MGILVCDKNEERANNLLAMLRGRGLLAVSGALEQVNNVLSSVDSTTILVIADNDKASKQQLEGLHGAQQIVVVSEYDVSQTVKASFKYDFSSDRVGTDQWLVGLVQLIEHLTYIYCNPLTESDRVRQVYAMAKKAAMSNASILIEGETGTGKELMAKYIHHHSKRAHGPFVAINCAAIPHTMIEAVLFGYEKGAFTNALQRHIGKFEQANGGTIFLDEIAEMSLELQSKLLRVLQENEVERIGSKEIKKVNVKVIAATNKNLKECVDNGLFRADLYYRINVVNLTLLPLVCRKEDIKMLCEYFIQLYSLDNEMPAPVLTQAALTAMMAYSWPGNVREMQNKIHRAVILNNGGEIGVEDLAISGDHQDGDSLKSKEAEIILNTLKETNGRRNDAAKKLRISPRTLRHKLMKLREIGVMVP